MGVRIDLAKAPPVSSGGAVETFAQFLGLSIGFALVLALPVSALVGLASLAIPNLPAYALLGLVCSLLGVGLFVMLVANWIDIRNRRVPHYEEPVRDIQRRLNDYRGAAPPSAFRAKMWGALNLFVAFAAILGITLAPLLRRLYDDVTPNVLLGAAMFPIVVAALLLPFWVLNGARLVAGYGSLSGVLAWFLGAAAPTIVLIATVLVCAFVGGLLGSGGDFNSRGTPLGFLAGIAIGLGGGIWASNAVRARLQAGSRAAALPKARDALWGDRRAPILFLRSFQDDYQRVADADERLEDALAKELSRFGPVIAIAEPNAVRKGGAARAEFGDDQWQAAVTAWMDQALAVVMVAGYTHGLRWELDEVIKRGFAKKLIVVFPADATHFDARWRRLEERFIHQPLGREIESADRRDAILMHADPKGRLVTFASKSRSKGDYESALALAIYGMFAAG